MNSNALSKEEFNAMYRDAANGDAASRQQLWYMVAERMLMDWDGVSYRPFVQTLPRSESAVLIAAKFQQGAAYDFLTMLTGGELPPLALSALEALRANEYLKLLLEVRAAFPHDRFPETVEAALFATRKHSLEYFETAAEKFATGVGMKRKLEDYAFDFIGENRDHFVAG